jgi:hypothetical protein
MAQRIITAHLLEGRGLRHLLIYCLFDTNISRALFAVQAEFLMADLPATSLKHAEGVCGSSKKEPDGTVHS